jgi:hypothetical protein
MKDGNRERMAQIAAATVTEQDLTSKLTELNVRLDRDLAKYQALLEELKELLAEREESSNRPKTWTCVSDV